MIRDVILALLFATPLGLALVIGILWLIRYGWRASVARAVRRYGEVAINDRRYGEEDPEDFDPEAVYR